MANAARSLALQDFGNAIAVSNSSLQGFTDYESKGDLSIRRYFV